MIPKKLLKELHGLKAGILFKNFTTYKIGGLAKYFFVAETKDDLMLALKAAKDLKLPIFCSGVSIPSCGKIFSDPIISPFFSKKNSGSHPNIMLNIFSFFNILLICVKCF